jgi:predicted  nucleic acid-binding Zn-ribbon protein
MEAAHAAIRPLAVLETVRCLECGEVYSKPLVGGTTQKNPGCPVCGYVGWIPINLPHEDGAPNRSAADRRRFRASRSR